MVMSKLNAALRRKEQETLYQLKPSLVYGNKFWASQGYRLISYLKQTK